MIKGSLVHRQHEQLCFRLLNSEIGNDHRIPRIRMRRLKSFRLLNSEIGNDQNEQNFRIYT